MSKFTKGEWKICNSGVNGTELLIESSEFGNNKIICNIGFCFNNPNQANARLIAAAPEMYQHLRLILNGEFSSDDVEQLLARIDGEEAK
ncbi:MAG: hypothetical protein IJ859_03780 [Synergistaceae bacterium]|nr:hypothetical protein [Synergistaceae bacterium]